MSTDKILVARWTGTDYLDEGPQYPYHKVTISVIEYDNPTDPNHVMLFEIRYDGVLVFTAHGNVTDIPGPDTVLHMVLRTGPRSYRRYWLTQVTPCPVDFKAIQWALWLWLRDSHRGLALDKLCITNTSLSTKETRRGLGLYGRNGREVIGWVKDGRFSVARAQPYWLRQGIETLYPFLIADTEFVDRVGGREDLKPII